MAKKRLELEHAEGFVPEVSIEGTAYECGRMLGHVWQDALQLGASKASIGSKPWWKDKRYAKLVDEYVPHLPDLYRGQAKSSGLREDLVGTRAAVAEGGCTSFAIAPSATLDGQPISGQTKDVSAQRMYQFQVLRLKCSDGPSALSLTYAGWLFGHGFVQGGCAIFRNSLFAGGGEGGLPYAVWGLLSLHCPTVEAVIELTQKYGVRQGFHCTVADERGAIVGIESGRSGLAFLKPKRGLYTHANAAVSGKRLQKHEVEDPNFRRADSLHRQSRLRERLEADHGLLTPQLALYAMVDHTNYPTSMCRHQNANAYTGGAVVVEPTRGLLHCTRGQPCRNWPRTYRL